MFGACESAENGSRPATEAVEKLLMILNERFAEPLTVPDLAEQVGLSQDHLARVFRAQVGMTIPRVSVASAGRARQATVGHDRFARPTHRRTSWNAGPATFQQAIPVADGN